jgi:hypothetical protein
MLVPPGEVRTIGRTIASDVVVEDNFMSGIHFELHNFGSYIELRDRNSTNKTFVDHSAQVRCNVTPGAIIRAGKTHFSLQWETLPKTGIELPDSEALKKTYNSQVEDGDNFDSPIGSGLSTMPVATPSQDSSVQNGQFPVPSHSSDSSRSSAPLDASPKFYPSRLVHHLETASEFDTCSMIDWLSERYHLRAIVHFRKIGLPTPNHLQMESVFPFLSESWRHLPVMMDAKEWKREELRLVTDSLAQSDGLMLVLVNETAAASADSALQRLCSFKVHGLSESNGFLGWCWPSQFQLISNKLSESCLSDFFGDAIQAIVFPSQTGWTAYAHPQLAHDFSKLGFE